MLRDTRDADPSWPEALVGRYAGIGLAKQAKSISSARTDTVPINTKLQFKPATSNTLPLKPRRYQEELFLKSLNENVIIYLGTGLGKTFITVLLLNSPKFDSAITSGRKVVFMAPTQDLVKQQAEYVYTKVPYKVRVYCGHTAHLGVHIDHWQASTWASELREIDILFMTPQIFSSAISVGLLTWSQFSLIIFDEVHHAVSSKRELSGKKSGTPYSQALKHFQLFCKCQPGEKPRFVGLTASLINNMPKSVDCIERDIVDLEKKLYARCVTDILAIESKPKLIIYRYTKPNLNQDNDKIILALKQCSKLLEEAVASSQNKRISLFGAKTESEKQVLMFINRLKLASHGFSVKPGSFYKILRQLTAIRINSGLWTFANICVNLYQAMGKHIQSPFISAELKPVYSEFASILKSFALMVDQFCGSEPSRYLLDYSQGKLLCLLEVLKQEHFRVKSDESGKATFSCIVFVRSRVEVFAVCGWLKTVSSTLPGYEFIKADYAIGLAATQNSKWACITRRKASEQGAMLNEFRDNILNVIVTTSVLEEGIDLPVCSTVIRYDSTDTFRVYVQSRGRSRQQDSSFIEMCADNLVAEREDRLRKFNDFEERVKKILSSEDRIPRRTSLNPGGDAPRAAVARGDELRADVFVDSEKGILIDSSMAKIILHMYCQRLSRLTPYSDGLTYERELMPDALCLTTLFFPPGCPVTVGVKGSPKNNVDLADSSACVAAYRALYMAGELDEHGVPIRVTEEHIDKLLAKNQLAPNFDTLDRTLEGEIEKKDNVQYHNYNWQLFNLRTSLALAFTRRTYKLYRVNFSALGDDCVRRDTRDYFEKKALGIIVDSKRSHLSWPKQLYSHYGQFKVEYELIGEDLKLDNYIVHRNYSNYTYRLMRAYWNLGRINKDDFKDNCLFYIVPLHSDGRVSESSIQKAFFSRQQQLRPHDLVKIGGIYRNKPEDYMRSYVVVNVHYQMDMFSRIPEGTRDETFLDRAREKYGHNFRIQRDLHIVEVMPIAMEVARTNEGKKVEVDKTTRPIFIPEQFLEFYEGDISTAFQAYNFPEIIYKIYLTTLASDLEDNFHQATAEDRVTSIKDDVVEEEEDCHRVLEKSDDDQDDQDDQDEDAGSKDEDQPGNESAGVAHELVEQQLPVEQEADIIEMDEEQNLSDDEYEENVHDDEYDSSSCEDEAGSSDTDSDDGPNPISNYRLVLQRQAFDLRNDKSRDIEKFDMSEYQEPLLKHVNIQTRSVEIPQKYVDTNPRLPSECSWLNPIMRSAASICHTLASFKANILANTDLNLGKDTYERAGKTVDPTIDLPISMDRISLPARSLPREMDFVVALTQRRSGEMLNLEGLENVGDSYLKYCVSVILHSRVDGSEGQLTLARSRLVGNKHFAHLAKKMKLGSYAIGRKFGIEILAGLFGGPSGGKNRLRSKDLADIFESIVGACLVYRGEFEAVMAIKWMGLNIFNQESFSVLHEHSVIFAKPNKTSSSDVDPKMAEHLKQSQQRVKRFQQVISYTFSDRTYLVQAFTHASSPLKCTETYERLEFLGDAILDFLVTMTLYHFGLQSDPGQMTSSRSALVNNCTFAKLAIKYKFDLFIQHANQELYDELNNVNECANSDPELTFMDEFKFDRICKVLGDVFESVAGAIYLDSGCSLDSVYRIYYPMMKEMIDAEVANPTKNLISQLFERFPGKDRIQFEFIKARSGDGSSGNDLVHVICDIYKFGRFHGEGLTKSQAKKRAVSEALQNLPTDEEQKRLDADYERVLMEKGLNKPRGNTRGARGRGFRRGRGRGVPQFSRQFRGNGNHSRPNQPYMPRADNYGRRGHYDRARH